MKIRTLEPGERDGVLQLLDRWELPDGWRGRDFFARYMNFDPSFREENFWVAERDGRLVSCVQVFPRPLRLGEGVVSLGGIGSVFTHPEHRSGGIASAVLARAEDAMRERGMALGLLFTGRLTFYAQFGWVPWPMANALYIRESDAPESNGAVRVEPFEPTRHFDAVSDLHAAYSAGRPGTVVRDTDAWKGNLRLAGNPDEDFRVAVSADLPVAYARFIALEGHPILAEFGRASDPAGADALATLLVEAFAERGGAYGPSPADGVLESALAARGIRVQPLGDPNAMLRCLDAKALCAAAGVDVLPGESDEDLLRRVLPPDRTLFWPADRF
jgi:GNAT superfamily N-acetyltransferase